MTEPTPPRPQPVLDSSKLAGYGQAAVTAVLAAVIVIQQGVSADRITIVGSAVAGAIAAVAMLVNYLLSLWHGKAAAAMVTPLSAPQNDAGTPLVPDPLHNVVFGQEPLHYDDHSPSMGPQAPDTNETVNPLNEIIAERIPEDVVPGKRLGRHVRHDPRSLRYLVPETDTPTTAFWQRMVPVFDQGNLGSCTGNAAAGVLGTAPFYATLPAGLVDDEAEAVKLYSLATQLDDYAGTYPPDDTGSDGLSVAKAAKQLGLISGYQHITSVAAAQTAIKAGPFITGVNWYSSMDNPDGNGLVTVSGAIRGGHEFECYGYDAQADLWWFTNSWGTSWGKDGTFCMSSASFARLLSEQGDATVFLPVAAPFPPQPTPQPPAPPEPTPPQPQPPTPTPPTPGPSGFPLAQWDAFEQHHRSEIKWQQLKAAVDAWLNGK